MNDFQNFIAQINQQMAQAKTAYDQTISSLQQQLQTARQQASNIFSQQLPQEKPAEAPENVQYLTILGEIKEDLKKLHEKIDTSHCNCSENNKKIEKNGSDKK